MLPIHTILHPTDFSTPSRNAFHLACALARDYEARLVVMHVAKQPAIMFGEGVPPPDNEVLMTEVREELERLEMPPGVHAERRVEVGNPVSEILAVADEIHADLIVMGTHGRTGLSRLLMGSVAEQVVRFASCPVLTVTGRVREPSLVGAAVAAEEAGKDVVQEASEESFPASDAPAWTADPHH